MPILLSPFGGPKRLLEPRERLDGALHRRLLACGAMVAPPAQTRRARRIDIALWVTTAVLTLLTLVFSFGLSPPGTGTFALADKLGHGAMYFATILCLLLAAAWRPGRGDGSFPTKASLFAIGFVIAGIVVEVLQEVATPRRHAEAGDVVAEVIGALGALAAHAWISRSATTAEATPKER
jgi:VanZ family protein